MIKQTLSLENILIEPKKASGIKSRFSDEISLETKLGETSLRVPLINSPVTAIDSPLFFNRIRQLGGLGCIHRFMSIDKNVEIYKNSPKETIVCVGVNGDWRERTDALLDAGAFNFLIDTANGFSKRVLPIIDYLGSKDVYIIAGNVASLPGYKWLNSEGLVSIRVGTGTGKICSTRRQTKCGYGLASALMEIGRYRSKIKYLTLGGLETTPVIADGSIKYAGDFAASLVLGADFVMCGNVFAQSVESSEGLVLYSERYYDGSASFYTQKLTTDNPRGIEGERITVTVNTDIESIFEEFAAGARSLFSYLDAHNIKQARRNSNVVVAPFGTSEGYRS